MAPAIPDPSPDPDFNAPWANSWWALRKKAAEHRESGDWGEWTLLEAPPDETSDAGLGHAHLTHRNSAFRVSDRTLANGVRHLCVKGLDGVRPRWPEMQRIKDEIAGPEFTAVEVYPPADEVIDQANVYHLWVLPLGVRLEFSLFDDRDQKAAGK